MEIEYIENCDLKNFSTMRIEGVANCVWFPKSEDEFIYLLKNVKNPLVIASGSNVLFSSFGVEKEIISTSKLDFWEIEKNILTVQCGVKGAFIANKLSQYGLSGLEFLIGFPARFGGAIFQNASAHSQAISDTFLSATVFDIERKEVLELSKDDMKFGYRTSVLNNKNFILLSAKFNLISENKENILENLQKNIDFRKNHQPMLTLPNLGSVFKNPDNNSAGKLLDECDFKGYELGGACVWESHANFIINKDNAKSLDILKLMVEMKKSVLDKFKVNLKPEINFICGKNKEEIELWKFLQE